MKNTTLLFLVKKSNGKIEDICLAMKKRGFGVGRWNGVGGKLHEGETIEQALLREAKEEIEVDVNEGDLLKVAELSFSFKFTPDFNQKVHVYVTEKWNGVPTESEEMKPEWYKSGNVPYNEMWPDDIFWLPKVLDGERVIGEFLFGEKDTVLEHKVDTVEGFN